MNRYLIISTLFFLCACSSVTSTVPIGESPILLVEKEWSGKWISTDLTEKGYLEMTVIDPEEGIISAKSYKDGKIDEKYLVHIRSTGDWNFFSIRQNEDDDYAWGVLRKRDHELLLWMPIAEGFVEAVRSGMLPGHVDDYPTVTLLPLTNQQIETMMSDKSGTMFFWQDPVIFIRPKE